MKGSQHSRFRPLFSPNSFCIHAHMYTSRYTYMHMYVYLYWKLSLKSITTSWIDPSLYNGSGFFVWQCLMRTCISLTGRARGWDLADVLREYNHCQWSVSLEYRWFIVVVDTRARRSRAEQASVGLRLGLGRFQLCSERNGKATVQSSAKYRAKETSTAAVVLQRSSSTKICKWYLTHERILLN